MSKKITDHDIEQGVAKVERMNKAFDKAIIPVLFIAALAVFLFGALPKLIRNIKAEPQQEQKPVVYEEELTLYEKRSQFMDELELNLPKIQQAGYEVQPEVQGIKSISKQYDENTVIAHFHTGFSSYGKIIKNGKESYSKADLQVNITGVSVNLTLADGSRLSARFADGSFAFDETLTDTDTSERVAVLEYITAEELTAMLVLYDAELTALIG